mmetsp:Transcript_27070/g.54111  ORF Transcript_27070/g.54111 Transcript_27070/m.54111 type:complete len:185 (+) Transcript_27070:237-791(+)
MSSLSFKNEVLRRSSCVDSPLNRQIRPTLRKHHSVPELRSNTRRDIRNIPGVVVKDEITDEVLCRVSSSEALVNNQVRPAIKKHYSTSELRSDNRIDVRNIPGVVAKDETGDGILTQMCKPNGNKSRKLILRPRTSNLKDSSKNKASTNSITRRSVENLQKPIRKKMLSITENNTDSDESEDEA